MSTINLGINNCFAVKRWPNPEQWASLVRNTLGLDWVQFSFDLLDPYTETSRRKRLAERTKKILEDNGLHLTSTFTGLAAYSWSMFGHPDADQRAEAETWWERAVDLTVELGGAKTGGHLGAISYPEFSSPRGRKEAVDRVVESVVKLTHYAKGRGLSAILWEAMATPREPPHSVGETKEILARVNRESAVAVELCLDLGHGCSYDLAPDERAVRLWLTELLPFTGVIHLQQSDGKQDHHWPFTARYNDAGVVDPKEVIEMVRNASLPREIELDFEIIHPFEAQSTDVLDELVESVGLWKGIL